MALDLPEASLEELWSDLSPDETRRAVAFHRVPDRQRFVAARGQLRRLLAAYTGERPEKLSFVYGPHGKPGLGDGQLSFNLSHSNTRGLCALTIEGPVGVDLEYVSAMPDFATTIGTVMSPLEKLLLRDIAASEHERVLYHNWTRKEAYLKALGLGLSTSPQAISISLAEDSPKLLEGIDQSARPEEWQLRSFHLGGEYVAAVAVRNSACRCIWQRVWGDVGGSASAHFYSFT